MTLVKNKLLNFGIKLLIGGLLAWALYQQVFAQQDVEVLWQTLLQHFEYPNLLWLVVVLLLAPVNLAFEALKWRQLIRQFTNLSFWDTFRAILAGTTIAIFTPNRVGEYGGRVLFVEARHNWKAVIATMVGSLAQLLALLSVGLLSTVWFASKYLEPAPFVLPLVLSLGIVLVGLLLFFFFNIDLLVPMVKRLPYVEYFRRYFKHLLVLKHYTRRELATALGFAFLRYLTYSMQYWFLLKFFGIPAPLLPGLAGISTIFFVQATIPLPPVMGLLARGKIALTVWSLFGGAAVNILAASYSLFVINIAVPALLGMACIVQTNIVKTFGYENDNEK